MQVFVVTEIWSGRVVGTALFDDVARRMSMQHMEETGEECDITPTIVGVMR